jgi:hypothetical protein
LLAKDDAIFQQHQPLKDKSISLKQPIPPHEPCQPVNLKKCIAKFKDRITQELVQIAVQFFTKVREEFSKLGFVDAYFF